MTKVLVAYASKHNATAEIARAIAEELRATGYLDVDVQTADAVTAIDRYDAVVLGSAVYAGQWQSAAAAFLKKHEAALSQRPVWLFSSGPLGEGDAKSLLEGWTLPEALAPLAEQIGARDVAVFHGRLDPAALSFLEKQVVKMVTAPVGDYRDWGAIRAWADGIAGAL